ncbi:MAG: 50S ribosomal protein L25/general stress protein Ctc [Acidobacteriota bacterium]
MKQQEVVIECDLRQDLGTNAARRLRRGLAIPAVVYGGGREPQPVVVDPRPVEHVLETERGLNTLIQLRVAGRDLKRMVMLRDVQRDPVTESLLHCDFVRVEMDEPVEATVAVRFEGTPVGVKNEGGLVEYVHREVTVRALPAEIPAHLVADISELHVGQHFEAGNLPLPEGVELITDPNETLCTIVVRHAPAEEEAAAAEAAEGEVPAEAGEEAAGAGTEDSGE